MRVGRVLLTLCLCLVAGLALAAEDEAIGTVHAVTGSAAVVRADEVIPAEKGLRLYEDDVLRTESEATLGIILRDDTTFSLGPSSEMAMNEFEFDPSEGLFSMAVRFVKGTFVYISGKIGELSPGAVEVETPVGIVAVRGTEFLARIK